MILTFKRENIFTTERKTILSVKKYKNLKIKMTPLKKEKKIILDY
jgi:hypothetical protein